MQFSESFGHLRLELLCDVGRKDDLARSGVGAHVDGFGSKSMVSRCELDEIVIAVEAPDCNLRQEVSTNKKERTLSLPYYSNSPKSYESQFHPTRKASIM